MTEELKKYKLYYLQKKYFRIVNILGEMEDHYNDLYMNHMIENVTTFSNTMYEIIKNLNSFYNSNINHYFENNTTDIDNIVCSLNDSNNFTILKVLDFYQDDVPTNVFSEIEKQLDVLIRNYGHKNIKSMIEYLYAPNYFTKTTMDLIHELNDTVIPMGYNIHTVNNIKNEYYWQIPFKYSIDDTLHKKRELWLRLKDSNKYLKIDVIFKIDRFSTKAKTTQLKSPILQKHRASILMKLDTTKINNKFIKSFIRHDYIGNIYCMTEIEYIDYITKMYCRYTKLIETTFVNIMKEFVAMDSVKKMYEIIFLLLLGTDDAVNIAGLLIGIIKTNKTAKCKDNMLDYLYSNMTFYIQSRIMSSNAHIKKSIDAIKLSSSEEVDYKKQLVICKHIPDNVRVMVLEKIDEMKSFNNEYYKQLLYVRTILNFPWRSPNDDLFYDTLKCNKKQSIEYLTNVETKLNNSCYGHDEAKKLLIQMIGKWISNPTSQGTCFGLVGPPGVGKTLLAKSVGNALDIPFGQITLGGQNDGELLHGHGYTYSGSQPGMIIKKMVEMGKSRCILYFDELDKACSKHGTINEITSILIHLTDPNMNKTFQDRFFQGIDFPLDKVIMIFSYNDSSLVDPILLDRLKEIHVTPYTMDDKLNICTKHLIPEMAETVSMKNMLSFDENTIQYLIDNYTNEAGVRDIKRKIEDIYLHLNIEKIYSKGIFKKNPKQINITTDIISGILKEPDTMKRMINDKPAVGIISGLYATSCGGGGITPIQIYPNTQHSNDKYEIKLTGKQGDTMKESVVCSLTVALEWLKLNNYDVDNLMKNNVKNGFHIHTPDGATPKDGPSAGCAFTCAFISRILNRMIRNDIAMTGEIELTGAVSKIGGLEFKLQGAKKAGIKTVYVPVDNMKDIDEIKEKYKNLIDSTFNVILIKHVNDVINEILIN